MAFTRLARFAALALAIFACVGPLPAARAETVAEKRTAQIAAKKSAFNTAFKTGAGIVNNKTYYVRTTGSDSNDGTSPAKAFKTIQKAVNKASVAGTIIIVGPGTYTESITFSNSTKDGTSAAPSQIVGDIDGALTGDAAGAVTVSGSKSRPTAVTMARTDYWHLRFLTFADVTDTAVQVATPGGGNKAKKFQYGLVIDGCTINVPVNFGIYAYDVGDLQLIDCDFKRTASSGHCTYIYATVGTSLTVTGNRMSLTGSLYASTSYKTGWLNTASGTSKNGSYTNAAYVYGIIAMAAGSTPCTVTVTNNVISDAYLGIYTYTYGAAHTLSVANNTSLNCLYGLYFYAYNSASATCSNNITGNSYIGHYVYAPSGRIIGLLDFGCTIDTTSPTYSSSFLNCASKTGITPGKTPMFADAASGDFSLKAGSPGIDAGYADIAPATDVLGGARPLDGDSNGSQAYDFGAFESVVSTVLRVVQWKQTDPDE